MCVSRIQRLMTAFVLAIVILLYFLGYTTVALLLQGFVIIMITVWAITNFCPSIWVLKKILPPCAWEK
jgi:hypothetical protein